MTFYLSNAQKGLNSPYEDLIYAAAEKYGVDPLLVKAIICKESGWNPRAHSSSSHGLMQLNATYFIPHGGTIESLYDPIYNIEIGTQTISQAIKRLGVVELALAAYNAGMSRLAVDLQQRINNNTSGVGDYVRDVLAYYDWYQQQRDEPLEDGGTLRVDVSEQGNIDPMMLGVFLLVGFILALAFRR